jgi:hypothetical protein
MDVEDPKKAGGVCHPLFCILDNFPGGEEP